MRDLGLAVRSSQAPEGQLALRRTARAAILGGSPSKLIGYCEIDTFDEKVDQVERLG
jgi:hypothetical protein